MGALASFIRLGLLVTSRAAASAAGKWQRRAVKLQIALDRRDAGYFSVKPVADIPAPEIDLSLAADPVAAIMASPEFAAATAFFADNPASSRSLLSPQSHALLYCLIRNLKPEHVFEIGTYRAGTTEAICRALYANGGGAAHTVDPFGSDYVQSVLGEWPLELLRHVEFYAMDSMAFYKEQERKGIRPRIVFVDGNHDYEYALFDIGCAARQIAPAGFIFVDDVSQPGPFLAARDFLAVNPGWRELSDTITGYDRDKAFDLARSKIRETDFMVLRAPCAYWVDDRPRNFGLIRWLRHRVTGVRLQLVPPSEPGTLRLQVVLRGFGAHPGETTVATTVHLQPGAEARASIALTPAAELNGDFGYFAVEPWLIWQGREPLQILQPPEPY